MVDKLRGAAVMYAPAVLLDLFEVIGVLLTAFGRLPDPQNSATFEGTAFHVSYVLASVAGIIIGAVMLRSDTFSRVAAYALILGDVIGLGLYVPTIGVFLSVISVPVLWVWYVLIARRLIRLGSGD